MEIFSFTFQLITNSKKLIKKSIYDPKTLRMHPFPRFSAILKTCANERYRASIARRKNAISKKYIPKFQEIFLSTFQLINSKKPIKESGWSNCNLIRVRWTRMHYRINVMIRYVLTVEEIDRWNEGVGCICFSFSEELGSKHLEGISMIKKYLREKPVHKSYRILFSRYLGWKWRNLVKKKKNWDMYEM